MLCKVCDRLNVTDLLKLAKANSGKRFGTNDYLYFEHHKRYDDLVTAASSGCELCLLLQRQCEEEEIAIDFQGTSSTRKQRVRVKEAENRPMNLRVGIDASRQYCNQRFEEVKLLVYLNFKYWEKNGRGDYWSTIVCSLQTPKDQPKFIDHVRIGQFIIDDDLASDANFDIARGWMNTCLVEHSESKCPSSEDKVLPSRVINVGLENSNPSLFLTDVLITRALGFQFLWIDSLCIIQDSKYDWVIESKKMGGIYQNSVLTIGAAAAHKAADGMLHTRSPTSRDMKPKLKLSKDSGSDDVVEIGSCILWAENLCELFASGPLQSRAWALQERILSPRILWYGRRQIYWQCLCGFQSANGMPSGGSDFPRSERYIYPVITQRLIFNQNCNDASKEFSEEKLLQMNHEYRSMVEDYSTRSLSCSDDKFPALSGIVALLHKAIGGHYLAGIWSKIFRENLPWHGSPIIASHTKQYRAPSWSWAATDRRVYYYNSSRLASTPHDPILLSHHIELSSENPYGAVKYAHIIFFVTYERFWDTGLGSLSPETLSEFPPGIPHERESETKISSGESVASIAIQTSFIHGRLRTSHSLSWDEETPDWSAVSLLEYKVMFVGIEQLLEGYEDSTPMLVLESCLECLILQEDPKDAKSGVGSSFEMAFLGLESGGGGGGRGDDVCYCFGDGGLGGAVLVGAGIGVDAVEC
ncbi:hypothetical protein EAF00_011254 [Botryotinia globosa]|nr:hypothetical protein EAF00_011254 [Botryotinia globosa]